MSMVHIYIYIYILIYIYVCVYVCMRVCVCACVCLIFKNIHAKTFTHTGTNLQVTYNIHLFGFYFNEFSNN